MAMQVEILRSKVEDIWKHKIFWCKNKCSSPFDNTVIEVLELQKREGDRLFLAKGALTVQLQIHICTKRASLGFLTVLLYEAVVLGWNELAKTTLHILIGRIFWLLSIQRDFFMCLKKLMYGNSCIVNILWLTRLLIHGI